MMEFNEEQKKAIEVQNKNVLVQAAAGSGKTRVLVEKIIRLICGIGVEPTSIEDILIMTFTNNATNEMKNRIKKGLVDKMRELDENGQDTTYIENQISMINNANIQTIDSFCKEIIDHNFTKLEKIDPKYRIAEDKELQLLKHDIVTNLLEEKYEDENYKMFFKQYFYRDDTRIREMLDKGLMYISSRFFPIQYILNIKNNFDEYNKKAKEDYIKYTIEDIKNGISKRIDKIEHFLNLLKDVTIKKDNEENRNILFYNIEVFKKIVNKIKKLYIGVDDDIFIENIIKYNEKIGFATIQKSRKSKNAPIEEIVYNKSTIGIGVTLEKDGSEVIYKNFRAAICDLYIKKTSFLSSKVNIVKNLLKITDEQVSNQNELLYLELLKEFYERYENSKIDKKILAIGDLQKYVIDLLYVKNNGKYEYSDFAKEIQEKYKYIFVDEYQDTSVVQEKIIEAISNGFKNKNVFMVGDVKQGIYRFRNADISIFNDKYEAYNDGKNDDNMPIRLAFNYRSCDAVVDFVNQLFDDVMTKDATKIDYKKDNELIHGRDEQNENISDIYKNMDRTVEYHVLTGLGKKDIEAKLKIANTKEEKEAINKLRPIKCYISDEADMVAQIIKKLHDEENVPYGDINVLLRKEKNVILHYVKSLQDVDIPAVCVMKEGFYDSYEIQLMIDILSVIDNPYDDIQLASVLTSCIIDVTNNELAFLKKEYNQYISSEKRNYFQLEDAIQMYMQEYENDKYDDERYKNEYDIDVKKLYDKLKYYDTKFNHYRDISRYKSISDLIYIVCNDTNYIHLINNMVLGNLRVENIKLLISKAKSYESTSYVGLNNFIRYLEHIKEREIDEGMAQTMNEYQDVVHLSTIHSSKGLEYNVVILPNLSSKYNEMSYKEDNKRNNIVCFNDKYGVSLNAINYKKRLEYVTPKRCLIDDIEKIESKSEEMRIFYVALTRAKEKLILVDRVSSEQKLNDVYFSGVEKHDLDKDEIWQFRSYSEMLNYTVKRLMVENNNKFKFVSLGIEELKSLKNVKDNNDDIDDVDILNNENIISDDENTYIKNLETNAKFVDKYEFLTHIMPKISVSDIKKEHYKEEKENKVYDNIDTYDIKDNDDKALDIKGTDVGNIYHRVMELYNFEDENVEKQIDDMIEKNIISKEAKDIIDIRKIKKLLESPLGKSLKKAQKNGLLYRERRFMKYFKRSEIEKYKGLYENSDIIINNNQDVDIIVQGIIDAFFIEENDGKRSITLIDYKTDGIQYNKVNQDNLVDRYKVQLDIYKKALEETVGIAVNNKIIYSFTLDKNIMI